MKLLDTCLDSVILEIALMHPTHGVNGMLMLPSGDCLPAKMLVIQRYNDIITITDRDDKTT